MTTSRVGSRLVPAAAGLVLCLAAAACGPGDGAPQAANGREADGAGAREAAPARDAGDAGDAAPATDAAPPAAVADDAAADDAAEAAGRAILLEIVAAESTLAYHGYRSVSRGPAGASRESRLRVIRRADGRTLVEWAPTPGAPAARRWSAECRHEWVRRPELLLRNYRVTADPAPSPPVAWRETRRVRIEGRRPGRPSLELLVDAETSLVLAETGRDFDGREWLRARFETLAYGEPPDATEPDGTEGLAREHTAAGRPADLPLLSPGFLPAGFELVDAHVSSCDPAAWIEDYSDGLAGVSLVVSPAGPDAPAEGEVRRRSRLGGGALASRCGEALAVVSGSLSDDDLLAILRGLRPAAPAR